MTGKPLELGGSQGRKEATGRGVMICCNKAIAKLGMKREGCRVIIQGFGNVGSQAAMLMHEAGYKIIGVADIHGGLYNENGIDVPNSTIGFIRSGSRCRNSPVARNRRRRDSVPPMRHSDSGRHRKSDHPANAHRLDCRILCEGANGPTTAQADAIIDSKESSSFPIFLATRAASPLAISNGCRTARAFSGARARSTSVCKT